MRRPLRYQLLLPWLGVTLGIVLVLSVSGAWLASQRVRSDLRHSLRNIAETLVNANFPVEDSVLRQAAQLSGAKFVAVDEQQRIRAASEPDMKSPESVPAITTAADLELSDTVELNGAPYFHAVVALDRRPVGGRREWLHILYPERELREARWQAIWPPLLAGAVATLCLLALNTFLASRVTRSIEQLSRHAEFIAQGRFEPAEGPPRDDEIGDLVLSINRMTAMLARYEEEVRRNERLRTLGQLGGSIAHQIRNAVTGCRMALDLHRFECSVSPTGEGAESLTVATRQLELMEHYLRRFLNLGRTTQTAQENVDLVALVQNMMPLVAPAASHAGVSLELVASAKSIELKVDPHAVEQILVNLMLNGIEAASGTGVRSKGSVTVRIWGDESSTAIDVLDNGPGIDASIGNRLFEPFVTTKADGVGLGLVTARDLARMQGGEIEHIHSGDMTCFRVRFTRATGT